MSRFKPGWTQKMFSALMKGKKKYGSSWEPKHGSRHRSSQMKAISRGRFSGKSSRYGL